MDDQGLFEAVIDSAVLLDKAGRVTHWNAGASLLFGYSRKEMLGKSINHIYDQNYPFPKLIQEVHTGKNWREETTFIAKNGNKGICRSHLCALNTSQDEKPSILLLHHNISPFKESEENWKQACQNLIEHYKVLNQSFNQLGWLHLQTANALEQAEQKWRENELHFHVLAQNTTDIISRHSPDGTYLYTSPACLQVLGYSPTELVGKNIHKLVWHEDQLKIKKAFSRRRDQPSQKILIYRIKNKANEIRWIESNFRLIVDEKRRHVNEIQLASRDITDRILDKKARLRGQQLAHVFRLSTMEEMASGMAHEISQPLAAIVNYTRGCIIHLENNNNDYTQLRNIMEKAASQAERAGEIVQRLKNFFCKGQLIKTSCKLNQVIRETVSLMKNELTTSKTKIDFDIEKEIPLISIDKIQIQQVILNLIQNAIESMQDCHSKDKRIHIEAHLNQGCIEITLSDSGIGFSKDIINKAFKPFFTTKAHGRGMGLAICRSIIEAHGGQFSIQTNNHAKSWIRFTLPFPSDDGVK